MNKLVRLWGALLLAACSSSTTRGEPAPTHCTTPWGGKVPIGQSYKDDCNTCHCEEGGNASCTGIQCDAGFPVDTGLDSATADDGTADSLVDAAGDADGAEAI
ncbi:MAG: hypothetical protein IPJ34_27145 [Myxococcales bacterium]|nr:hypothetical protein [Myxococcales bacterium]